MGKQWKHWKTLLSWIPTSLQLVTSALKLKMLAPWKKSCGQPRQHIKKQRYNLANRGPSSQSYGFSNSRVQRWELDLKKGWESKNWCICTRVLEKTLDSSTKRSNQSILKEISREYLLEGLMLKLKLQYLATWLIEKDPDAGKD